MTTGDKSKFEALMNRVTVACSFIGTKDEKDALKTNFWNYLKRWNFSEVELAMEKFINSLYGKERDGNPNPRDVESFIVRRAEPVKEVKEDITVYQKPDWWIIEHKGNKDNVQYQDNYHQIWQIFMHVYNGLGKPDEAKTLARYWNRTGKLPPEMPSEYYPQKNAIGVMQVDGVGAVTGAMQF